MQLYTLYISVFCYCYVNLVDLRNLFNPFTADPVKALQCVILV